MLEPQQKQAEPHLPGPLAGNLVDGEDPEGNPQRRSGKQTSAHRSGPARHEPLEVGLHPLDLGCPGGPERGIGVPLPSKSDRCSAVGMQADGGHDARLALRRRRTRRRRKGRAIGSDPLIWWADAVGQKVPGHLRLCLTRARCSVLVRGAGVRRDAATGGLHHVGRVQQCPAARGPGRMVRMP